MATLASIIKDRLLALHNRMKMPLFGKREGWWNTDPKKVYFPQPEPYNPQPEGMPTIQVLKWGGRNFIPNLDEIFKHQPGNLYQRDRWKLYGISQSGKRHIFHQFIENSEVMAKRPPVTMNWPEHKGYIIQRSVEAWLPYKDTVYSTKRNHTFWGRVHLSQQIIDFHAGEYEYRMEILAGGGSNVKEGRHWPHEFSEHFYYMDQKELEELIARDKGKDIIKEENEVAAAFWGNLSGINKS